MDFNNLVEAISVSLATQLQDHFSRQGVKGSSGFDDFMPQAISGNQFNQRRRAFNSSNRNVVFKNERQQPKRGFSFRSKQGSREYSKPTKLMIQNLAYHISDDDIKELYFEFGRVVKYGIHYDENGKSLGTAEVHYQLLQSAMMAIARYNNVTLDGRPMRLSIAQSRLPVRMRLTKPFFLTNYIPRRRMAQNLAKKFLQRSRWSFFKRRNHNHYKKPYVQPQRTYSEQKSRANRRQNIHGFMNFDLDGIQ